MWVNRTTSCLVAVHLHTLSTMMTLTITEYVQGSCRSSLQMSANRLTRKCPYRFLSDIVKKGRFYCNGLSYALKQEGTFLNLQLNIMAWSGNVSSSWTKNLEVCSFCRQSVNTLFWDFNRFILKHCQDHGWTLVHGIVLCLKGGCNAS